MLTIPKEIQPLKVISNKVETKEQLIVPKGIEPIKSEKSDKKEKSSISPDKNNSCVGWNKPGCFSDSIKKVQACMNVGVSGNFDDILKNTLASFSTTYAYKDGFNDSDVQKICTLKQEEDRQEALKREQLAKQAQKAMEDQAFERNYPQKTTKATRRDKL
jgi:hypothetical protein